MEDRNNNILPVIIAIVIIFGIGYLIIHYKKVPESISKKEVRNTSAHVEPVFGKSTGLLIVKISKIDGANISYILDKKTETIATRDETQFTKEVVTNGIFRTITSSFGELKVGQFIELMADPSGQYAATIKILK